MRGSIVFVADASLVRDVQGASVTYLRVRLLASPSGRLGDRGGHQRTGNCTKLPAMRWSVIAAVAVFGCSSRPSPPKLETAPLPGTGNGSAGSAVSATTPGAANRPADGGAVATPQGKPIGIHLRSSPSGAQIAVDGVAVGRTPTYWSGVADGRAHDFTFSLAAHEVARYHFVPVTSGVIHARMVAVADNPGDGGISAPSKP